MKQTDLFCVKVRYYFGLSIYHYLLPFVMFYDSHLRSLSFMCKHIVWGASWHLLMLSHLLRGQPHVVFPKIFPIYLQPEAKPAVRSDLVVCHNQCERTIGLMLYIGCHLWVAKHLTDRKTRQYYSLHRLSMKSEHNHTKKHLWVFEETGLSTFEGMVEE